MGKHDKNDEGAATPATRSADWADMVERWFGEWPRLWPEFRRNFGDTADVMKVEEFTEGDQLVVRAEMPGIDPDKDVHISVSDHTLRLRAERRQETTTDDGGSRRSEFHYGSFARSITLPAGASDKDVKATYRDGILEVRIPVDRREAESKKVPVQRI